MKHLIQKDAVSRIEYIFIQDSSVTTGAGKTGLVFNTASLTAYYVRAGAAAVAITLVTQTVTGAFSSGGFVEVDATNMPGIYRLDVPNAAFATGVDKVALMLKGAANMAPVLLEYQLTGFDPAALTWMASYTQPTGFLAATFPAGTVANTTNITAGTIATATAVTTVNGLAAGVITAASIAADAITDAKVAADVTIASVTGAVGSVTGAVGSVTGAVGSVTADVGITQAAADKVFGASGAALPELAQAIPSATPSPRAAMTLLYMALRNTLTVTATTKAITNDAGVVIAKKALTDDGTTYAEAEMVAGP